MAEARDYQMFARDNCMAMVHGGSIGSSGIMTESGLAYLVYREDRPFFVGKGGEAPAQPADLAALRKFSEDLKHALEG